MVDLGCLCMYRSRTPLPWVDLRPLANVGLLPGWVGLACQESFYWVLVSDTGAHSHCTVTCIRSLSMMEVFVSGMATFADHSRSFDSEVPFLDFDEGGHGGSRWALCGVVGSGMSGMVSGFG